MISLLINTLASRNYCLCHRNVFQNNVNTFSKMVNHFCKNLKILYHAYYALHRPIRLFSSNFTCLWSKYLSNNIWRNFSFIKNQNKQNKNKAKTKTKTKKKKSYASTTLYHMSFLCLSFDFLKTPFPKPNVNKV